MKRFISQLSSWLPVVVVLLILVSVSQGAVVITTTASVGPPPISPTYASPGYVGRVLSGLSTGTAPGGYPAPAPWLYASAPAYLNWGDVAVDNSGLSVWEGQIVSDTTSPFHGEKGTAFYVNAKFVGDGVHKFTASDVTFQVTSSDSAHSLSAIGSLAGLAYGVDPIIGVCYGPDGLIHTADDIIYNANNPAPGSTPVDWLIYSGVAVAYNATDVGLQSVQDYVNAVGPFDLTIAYSLNDGTGLYSSSQTRTVVPEPATISLMGLGAIALIRRRRRQ